eukprot:3486162-Ditylum_brightwellii.AAC.1
MHWQEFKRVETSRASKNLDGTDTSPKGVCYDMFKACLQELKNITSQRIPPDCKRLTFATTSGSHKNCPSRTPQQGYGT